MKKTTKLFSIIFLTAFNLTVFAQENKKEQISKALEKYFFLERENIHVHLDKHVFLSNESIWFKGYVYHKKLDIPFFSCVNIFANLIDSDGNIIESQLLYGNLGNFSGSFKLNDHLESGKYYIQFYTNWMNNFTEDESSVYDVTIINPETGIPASLTKNAEAEVNIDLQPEGGVFLNECQNTIAVHVSGCDNTPLDVKEALMVNSKGETIKKIVLNDLGYGKFDMVASNKNDYKVSVTVKGKNYEEELPPIQAEGITTEVNSYVMADKTIIKFRTNEFTYKKIKEKPLFMVIHKDDKASAMQFAFNDKLEVTALIENKELFEGVNTLRLLDNDLHELSERLFYVYPQEVLSTQLNKASDDNGTVEFTGKVNNPYMNLSISVIPANTKSIEEDKDIFGDLLLSPYIEGHPKSVARQYLNEITRSNKFEMDLYLMNKKSKYHWNNILNNSPKENYSFDIGLSLKGKVNQKLKGKGYRIKVSSFTGMLDERAALNDQNEFVLKNLIVPDSCKLKFTLLKRGEQPQVVNITPQIINNKRPFNKPFKPSKQSCIDYTGDGDVAGDLELPKYTLKTVMLEEVKVEGKTTNLKYGKVSGNGLLRGYKITEADTKSFFYILDFIRYHGFDVSRTNMGEVSITGRTVTTIQGQKTRPRVYMNNTYLMSYDILDQIQTEDVEEFYINQHAPVPGVDNQMGIIKIYMKTDYSYRQKKTTDSFFIIDQAFETIEPFKNSDYTSTYDDKGFENFGIIDWHPNIMTDENGKFSFSIPKLYFGPVKILIEGFGANGKIISEVKTINL